jgi:hypothetical protein
MEPNPLQYQATSENQPLYQAALLSGGAVLFLVVVALGINFFLHQGHSPDVAANRAAVTSPDDAASGPMGGMSNRFAPSPSLGSDSMRNFVQSSVSPPAPSRSYVDAGDGFSVFAGGAPLGHGRDPGYDPNPLPSGDRRVSVVRDFASVSPSNLGPLVMGN